MLLYVYDYLYKKFYKVIWGEGVFCNGIKMEELLLLKLEDVIILFNV